jgi:transcriptional regulator with AAA-type ATPase domain
LTNPQRLEGLLRHMSDAASFEQAAKALLQEMFRELESVIEASEYSECARISRGAVHLRPDGTYRGLSILEYGQEKANVEATADPFAVSNAAWKYLEAEASPLVIDVLEARLDQLSENGESRAAMSVEREPLVAANPGITHVFVTPISFPAPNLLGMVSLEVSCERAAGTRFVWPQALEALGFLVRIAAPYLVDLPHSASGGVAEGDFLPVTGKRMAQLVPMLQVFAQQRETLLITGPSGAGKSRLAEAVHRHSPQSGGPFQTLDLLSVPDNLQMARLFGWNRGAFTSADKDTPGAVERASEGTLFIDEIDKLSLEAQAGLLRLMETRYYQRIGDTRERQADDVRFIIGTNADLREAVNQGRFREDLFYRINVLRVDLPPLSERRDEIADWASHMAERRHREYQETGNCQVSASAARTLALQPWPGNLRQLDNVMVRAYAFATADDANPTDGVIIQEKHVRQALGVDESSGADDAIDLLEKAGRALFETALRRVQMGLEGGLELKSNDVLFAMVWAVALRELNGDHKVVADVIGRARSLAARNYHKDMRRELTRLKEFYESLGREFPDDMMEYIR